MKVTKEMQMRIKNNTTTNKTTLGYKNAKFYLYCVFIFSFSGEQLLTTKTTYILSVLFSNIHLVPLFYVTIPPLVAFAL